MSLVSSDSASMAIRFLERMADRVAADPLHRLGLDHNSLHAALKRTVPLTPAEVRRSAANAHPRMRAGRRGLPAYVVEAMYADYLQHKSLATTASLYRRTRQAVWDIFRRHGKTMEPLKRIEKVIWNGRAFTPGKRGYLRETTGDREMLHRAMWKAAHGQIPPGYQVTFKNANQRDFCPANLACMPIGNVTRLHSTGHNQFTRRRKKAA
jgi:hypothetical protein